MPSTHADRRTDAEERIRQLGITLPAPRPPVANYLSYVRVNNLIFLAGHGPVLPDGSFLTGKVGAELSLEEGYQAAKTVCLQLLATMREAAGSLDNIGRVIKVLGMVNATSDFRDHPKVINGCSDLFAAVFGERGRHARSAVGVGSLPGNMAVEIEAIVEILE